eukprot:15435024-Alexandrium_andersonii.AAC.1
MASALIAESAPACALASFAVPALVGNGARLHACQHLRHTSSAPALRACTVHASSIRGAT